MSLKEVWNRLMAADSFAIACHQRPDGDALGSLLALGHALRAAGKDVTLISSDGVPENYTFIPDSETIVTTTDRRDFDLGIIIDCPAPNRTGPPAEIVESARVKAVIDHHIPEGDFGDIRIIDTNASATAQIILQLLDAGGAKIDNTTANQLLTGLIADTGGFRFANANARAFEDAARLAKLGAEPSHIYREVYDNRPLRAIKLLGKALESIKTDEHGFVAWATVTRKDMDEFHATDADTDSIVNHVVAVKGPRVVLLFREVKPDSIRVSLRSRDGVDVNKIGRVFGGGGHAAAAGCTLNTTLQEAQEAVIAEVLKWTEP
ncbi:MAG: bifunctional oligoribonuclease/PAP phosphatase NrnA [Armatimonadetes bacterium]|nr:bifunctional oligoribonuclease/PAP phosphatase NrnA [Armatimonadota bacterium]